MSYDDLNDHPFAVFMAGESFVSDAEKRWLKWCKDVERLLGHSLDGDDVSFKGDGYSLDEAYDWFKAGDEPGVYVADVRSRARYKGTPQIAASTGEKHSSPFDVLKKGGR